MIDRHESDGGTGRFARLRAVIRRKTRYGTMAFGRIGSASVFYWSMILSEKSVPNFRDHGPAGSA
jgi:hypothetical protein